MVATTEVRRVGKSLGILLPQDVVESLRVAEGDDLLVVRTPDGIQLTPCAPDFTKMVDSTRDYMSRHRKALQELARRRSR